LGVLSHLPNTCAPGQVAVGLQSNNLTALTAELKLAKADGAQIALLSEEDFGTAGEVRNMVALFSVSLSFPQSCWIDLPRQARVKRNGKAHFKKFERFLHAFSR
jgi:hypothetical protein